VKAGLDGKARLVATDEALLAVRQVGGVCLRMTEASKMGGC
jgi:hypothetical protein